MAKGQGGKDDRRVGAEVSIGLKGDGSLAEDHARYRADARVDVVEVGKDHLKLRVKGMKPEGTRLFLRLDPSVVAAHDLPGLTVSLDGTVVPKGSLTEVLSAQGGNPSDARHAPLSQGEGVALVSYLHRISTQGAVLSIDSLHVGTPVIGLQTLEVMAIGAAVVALSALLLFRRRH
jgi:hypothetical protein